MTHNAFKSIQEVIDSVDEDDIASTYPNKGEK